MTRPRPSHQAKEILTVAAVPLCETGETVNVRPGLLNERPIASGASYQS